MIEQAEAYIGELSEIKDYHLTDAGFRRELKLTEKTPETTIITSYFLDGPKLQGSRRTILNQPQYPIISFVHDDPIFFPDGTTYDLNDTDPRHTILTIHEPED